MENSCNKSTLTRTAKKHLDNINKPEYNYPNNENNYKDTIKLPWIPIIGPKLRIGFKKKGIRTVFKSSANLKSMFE